MIAPIAAAATTREMVHQALETDAAIVALLPDGDEGILPRNGHKPDKAKTPFLIVRYEGEGSTGTDDMDRGTWAIEVHDRLGNGLAKIDRLVELIKRRFDHRHWETPTASRARPRRSWRASATGELPDLGYSTTKRVVRFALYQS